jgi:uncharacterized membrane protein SirB2
VTSYLLLKNIHQATAVITIALFFTRGLLVFRESAFLRKRWIRILPHVNDTILLICAIWLSVLIGQYPFVHHWLTAKVLLLLAYIGLGFYVMRSKAKLRYRVIAWILALIVVGLIVIIAINKSIMILDI